jgi:hypothetical protein
MFTAVLLSWACSNGNGNIRFSQKVLARFFIQKYA